MAPRTLKLLKILIIFANISPPKSPHVELHQLLLRLPLEL